jgi:hypothetical protein
MARYGYELDQVPMDRWSSLRYALLEWPLNAARLAAWRARTWLARSIPRLAGRQPPRRHVA